MDAFGAMRQMVIDDEFQAAKTYEDSMYTSEYGEIDLLDTNGTDSPNEQQQESSFLNLLAQKRFEKSINEVSDPDDKDKLIDDAFLITGSDGKITGEEVEKFNQLKPIEQLLTDTIITGLRALINPIMNLFSMFSIRHS